MKKIIISIIAFFAIILILGFLYLQFFKKEKKNLTNEIEPQELSQNSNIIENVQYSSKDSNGNEYIIKAKQGEIDIDKSNIIFLKNVSAVVNLKNSNKIFIFADFGKYNINNFDTIFSKNVIINYLEKKISSEYLDFSIIRNSMIISKNVIYKDLENNLETDVIEINIKNKSTKFYMYNKDDKVKIINQK